MGRPGALPFAVVFSDIDDVLRPSDDSFETAAAILRQLDSRDAALILTSGKTRAELEHVQQRLGVWHPFICEHGAAVFIPKGYFGFDIPQTHPVAGFDALELGRSYSDVVRVLNRVAERANVDIVSFDEMSIVDVAHDLGLPLLEARLAKLREYGELFRVVSQTRSARERMFRALEGARLHCIAGRQFDFVGARVDRAFGINFLKQLFRLAHGAIVGLGITDLIHEDGLVPFVDHSIVAAPGGADGTVDGIDWAEAIVEAVRHVLPPRSAVNAC